MGDPQPTPVDALARLSFLVQERLAAIAAAEALSMTQLRLLGILRDREPAMLDLARHLGLGKSSVSGLVDRAAHRGLVERIPGAHDARAVHVRLTDAGRDLASRLTGAADAALAELLSALSPRDADRLGGLAAAVVAGQDAAGGGPSRSQRLPATSRNTATRP